MAEIEKGIPLPIVKHPTRKSKMGPIVRAMEVGDSYLCVDEFEACNAQAIAVSSGMKFARRKQEGGYRIWRVT